MFRKVVVIGLGAMLLAACAPVPAETPQPAPPPSPAAAASEADMTEGQPLAPVDVRAMTCKTLTSATDDDKAYASMFLLGYRSALLRLRTIEIKKIEAVEETALAQCVATPDALATKVFAAALVRIQREGEPAIRWTHKKLPAETPTTQEAPPAPGTEPPAQEPPQPE